MISLQLSIPLTSRKEEREHAVQALDEVRAVEEVLACLLEVTALLYLLSPCLQVCPPRLLEVVGMDRAVTYPIP